MKRLTRHDHGWCGAAGAHRERPLTFTSAAMDVMMAPLRAPSTHSSYEARACTAGPGPRARAPTAKAAAAGRSVPHAVPCCVHWYRGTQPGTVQCNVVASTEKGYRTRYYTYLGTVLGTVLLYPEVEVHVP